MSELIDLTRRFSSGEGIQPTAVPQLKIVRNDRQTERLHTVYGPSLCFIVQGEKEALIAEKIYRYSPAQYLVTSVDVPVTGQVTVASSKAPFLCLVVEIEPGLVYEILRDSQQLDAGSAAARSGIYTEKVNLDLSDAMLRLLRTLKKNDDTLILAPLIIREITYRLLSSKYGEAVRQLGVAGSRTQRIAKVLEKIKKDFAEPLRTEDLAKVAGMSPSSFHEHFKKVTTMSPLQYQKALRLQEARRLLSASVVDAASAGFQVGYESPSQFSREYARMFGLPPISDMKRRRS